MSAVKRLIVNADDFGGTPGVNQGILEAHTQGIVTSTTLWVAGQAAEEAGRLALATPSLGVGLQLSWTEGKPLSSPDQVRTLVDPEGRLPPGPEGLSSASPEDILSEARVQLKRFRELLGRLPTHLVSHAHAQRLPAVLEALMTLSWETGLAVRSLSPPMRQRFRKERIPTTDHFVEGFESGNVTSDSLALVLGELSLGTTELRCRPAVVDGVLRAARGYAEPRGQELRVLTDREARQALQAAGVRLIHFGQL